MYQHYLGVDLHRRRSYVVLMDNQGNLIDQRRLPNDAMPDYVAQLPKSTFPKNFLPKVTSPVLAFFGEDDQLVPAQKSAELYEQYLNQAGNKNFKIVVFPNADHGLYGATNDYWKILSEWLGGLFSE